MRWYADWLRLQMQKLGVEIRMNASPGMEELSDYDAVVIATGGHVARPDVPGIDLPLVKTFEDVLRCRMESCEFYFEGKQPPSDFDEHVLIWGDHFGAADAAEKLGVDGHKVTIVTENSDFATWMEPLGTWCTYQSPFKAIRKLLRYVQCQTWSGRESSRYVDAKLGWTRGIAKKKMNRTM